MTQRVTQSDSPSPTDLEQKLARLREILKQMGSVLVCFSGGLDSGFLLSIAHQVLGAKAIALTATGPALAPAEYDDAVQFAKTLGVRHELIDAKEMQREGYVANGPDRCFHCKSALYATAETLKATWQLGAVVNGTNTDDLGDYRPGLQAAEQAAVRSPMVEAGLSKAEIRHAAKQLGVRLWDKPAAACLASRIPYGTAVTPERLTQVAGLEAELKKLGLRQVRVRYHEQIARIEVDGSDLERVASNPLRDQVVEAGRRHGFVYVTLDLAGYRVGSLNEVLSGKHLRTLP